MPSKPVLAIRRATADDLPAMAEILALTDEPVGWPDMPGWPYLEHLRRRADVLVAVDPAGQIVGFGGALDVGPSGGRRVRWLSDLFVHPDRQSAGAGRTLLDILMDGAEQRMTESSADPRALSLYLRAGMRPWWPMLYVSADLRRLPAGDPGVSAEPADVASTASWVERWTGRDRAADFGYFSSLPGAAGFVICEVGAVAAAGWSRRERDGQGRWLEHLSIAPDADPLRVTIAALRAATAIGGVVGAIIPAPHPAVPALLDQGMRILAWDTFCATDPDLIDPARLLPNAGLL